MHVKSSWSSRQCVGLLDEKPGFVSQARHQNKNTKSISSTISFQQISGKTLMVFSFLPKNVHFISNNAKSCLFLKNASPSKRVICFILNNLHFPMVEGIAFYALHKSRMLIIQMAFVYLQGYQMKFTKRRLVSLSNLELNFFIVLQSKLKKTLHYLSYIVSNIKNLHSVLEQFKKKFFLLYKQALEI